MKRAKAGIVMLLILVVGGYFYAQPYIVVDKIKAAAEAGDGEALVEHIDFPALRQSLKDQLNYSLGEDLAKDDGEGDPFAAIGAAIGGAMVDKVVDSYVTPAGVRKMLKGTTPKAGDAVSSSNKRSVSEALEDAPMQYESFDKFSILKIDDDSGKKIKYVLRRRGFDWKLTEILFPL